MVRKISWLLISCFMAMSLVMASCGTTKEEEEAEVVITEEEVSPSAEEVSPSAEEVSLPEGEAEWWDKLGKPQYGGEFTYRVTSDLTNFDSYYGGSYPWLESMGMNSWTIDRKVWDFKSNYMPDECFQGVLAESWEQPDPQTFIVHLHKGIRWWDKPPVNGREFTAYDIEYGLHRNYGLGSGYNEVSPYCRNITPYSTDMKSVTAIDKYTVVFEWGVPSVDILYALFDRGYYTQVEPRELIEGGARVSNWKDVVGTAPFMLTDYVAGSCATFVSNPNYWGYDERHPDNKLPYVNQVKWLVIPDLSSAIAALRTGKIDAIGGLSWEQGESLAKTNPELMEASIPTWAASLALRCDTEPFIDIRVRKALQMSIDFKAIAQMYYGGHAETVPYGPSGPLMKGYYTPFDEWPEEVKEGYTYNPEGAKKLLADAGYPNGFKTNVIIPTTGDISLLELVSSYFSNINVEMELKSLEPTAWTNVWRSWSYDQIIYHPTYTATSQDSPIIRSIARGGYSKSAVNFTRCNDSYYDQLYDRYAASLDNEERTKIALEADLYALAQYWRVTLPVITNCNVYQPWVKGYSGERGIDELSPLGVFQTARHWIDHDLK
jgi:peptide/nickel transport system substrate-binding protein